MKTKVGPFCDVAIEGTPERFVLKALDLKFL